MMSQTLLSIQASNLSCDIVAMTKDALQQLIDEGLVVQKRSLSQGEEIFCHAPSLEVTPLGRATFKGTCTFNTMLICESLMTKFCTKNIIEHILDTDS